MDTTQETRIYNAYRAQLKSLREASGSRDSRTAARKQVALKTVADRYKVPMGDVKRLVRARDAAAGVEHKHPDVYLQELAFEEKWQEARAHFGDSPCSVCGTTDATMSIRPRMLGAYELFEGDFLKSIVEHRGYASSPIPSAKTMKPEEWVFVQACYPCKMNTIAPLTHTA
jgi:hypothetical protein